jgi:lipopolysaccharide biosynthesis glycosyltransferase
MNLKKFRESDFYGKFCELLGKYKFEVAQDQDYLNVLCQGKVKFIDPAWNVMPIGAASKTQPKLVHYNLTRKPWHYTDVRYQDYFWEYAKKTEFYDRIMQHLRSFTAENAQRDAAGEQHLIDMCIREAGNENNYYRTFGDSAKIADTFAARK